ncbi:hypothetical protein Tco_0718317 [Tanacetum coccineum]
MLLTTKRTLGAVIIKTRGTLLGRILQPDASLVLIRQTNAPSCAIFKTKRILAVVRVGVVMVRGCGGDAWNDRVVMVYSGAWRGWW